MEINPFNNSRGVMKSDRSKDLNFKTKVLRQERIGGLFPYALASIFLHLIFAISFQKLQLIRGIDLTWQEKIQQRAVPIKVVKQKPRGGGKEDYVTKREPKKIKTVGTKDGTGKGVYEPQRYSQANTSNIKYKNKANNSVAKSKERPAGKTKDDLFIDPTQEVDPKDITMKPDQENNLTKSEGRIFRYSYKPKSPTLKSFVSNDLKDATKSALSQVGYLKNSQFSFAFDPPPGVSLSELNKLEQIFYGFNLRLNDQWASAFFKSGMDYMKTNPNVQFKRDQILGEKMRGVVRFDKEGNIQRIKIIKWSSNDHLQNIFQTGLENLKAIPNPPRAFVEKQDYFDIVFGIEII